MKINLTNISKTEQIQAARAGEKASAAGSIMQSQGCDNPRAEAEKILNKLLKSKQNRTNFLEAINEITKTRSPEVLNIITEEYFMRTQKSFIGELYHCGSLNDKTVRNGLKALAKRNSLAYSDFLANDLLKVLNGNDKNYIKTFINRINKNNVQDVYALYFAQSETYGEIAATDKEKKLLNNYFLRILNTKGIKNRARRTETIFQGILNNKVLNSKEKKEYLAYIVNMFNENAKLNMIDQTKIDKFSKFATQEVKNIANAKRESFQNACDLEDALADLYGW